MIFFLLFDSFLFFCSIFQHRRKKKQKKFSWEKKSKIHTDKKKNLNTNKNLLKMWKRNLYSFKNSPDFSQMDNKLNNITFYPVLPK